MDSTNRITVARVRAALEETGATLERGITWDAGRRCGCPIGITAVAEAEVAGDIGIGDASRLIDLPDDYVDGLIDGFDDMTSETVDGREEMADDPSVYLLGHADGMAIVAELMSAGPPKVEDEAQ